MKTIIIGFGVQGSKRYNVIGQNDCSYLIDPTLGYFDTTLDAVPLDEYDAACVCTPELPKLDIIRHLLSNGKHVLVEKPLYANTEAQIQEIEALARANNVVCYAAYNHRFEPHIVRMRELLASRVLGSIYHCRMFYGFGTAVHVKESPWRDFGQGVLRDIGVHLLDMMLFWDWGIHDKFSLHQKTVETRAPDVCALVSNRVDLTMTCVSWRNTFTVDILAENGSAHIDGLCKWGPSTFIHRKRVLPSGRPTEESTTIVMNDPTWQLEWDHFCALIRNKIPTDLSRDRAIHRALEALR